MYTDYGPSYPKIHDHLILFFFFNRGFPQNMKANISIWSTRIGWVENYIHRSEYNDLKMAILLKKKPARLILVIQFTYKG